MINEEREKLQKEAFLKVVESGFNCAVIAPTGVGKSNIIVRCLKYLKDEKRIVYGCDNTNLRDKSFPAELKIWGMEDMIDKIERKCYQSLYKIKGQKYDVFFADEGDYMLTPEYVKFLKNNKFKHIIFLSATLDDSKRKMIEEFVPIVFEKKIYEIEGKGVVNDADFYFVNYMLTPAENRKYLAYNEAFKRQLSVAYGSTRKIDQKTVDAITRNRKLFMSSLESSANITRQLLKKLYQEEYNKILVFCTVSAQADKVCRFSYHSGNAKDSTVLSDFDSGKIRVMSVCGMVDRGLNINGVNSIVFESPAESKTKMTQRSGRGRRLDINEKLKIYFLVPFYKDRLGQVKPTIVQKWVMNSTKDMNIENAKVYTL